jgi:hypothetical protein
MAALVNRETNRISKVLGSSLEQYKDDGDEDKFFEALGVGNVSLSDEDKEAMLDKGWFWDDIIAPDSQWMRKKANQNLENKVKSAGKQKLLATEEKPENLVKYGGKLYTVEEDGNMVEVK